MSCLDNPIGDGPRLLLVDSYDSFTHKSVLAPFSILAQTNSSILLALLRYVVKPFPAVTYIS